MKLKKVRKMKKIINKIMMILVLVGTVSCNMFADQAGANKNVPAKQQQDGYSWKKIGLYSLGAIATGYGLFRGYRFFKPKQTKTIFEKIVSYAPAAPTMKMVVAHAQPVIKKTRTVFSTLVSLVRENPWMSALTALGVKSMLAGPIDDEDSEDIKVNKNNDENQKQKNIAKESLKVALNNLCTDTYKNINEFREFIIQQVSSFNNLELFKQINNVLQWHHKSRSMIANATQGKNFDEEYETLKLQSLEKIKPVLASIDSL